jgi:hypothetical protein
MNYETKDNRATQLPTDEQFRKGISLTDIDTSIFEYVSNQIIPDLDENGVSVKVPLIYGNSERWVNARKDGYLRDSRGKIQTPIVMFKRNSIERDSSMQHFREQLTMPAYKKYSTTNRYDRFSLLNNEKPVYEQYSVAIPAYVTITYELMLWTAFTEQMNKIVEAFQFATDRYWGDPLKYKFRVRIENFDNQQDVGDGTERVIRTTFTLSVNAYLLPDEFAKKPVVGKSYSPKRIIVGMETDLTGENSDNSSLSTYASTNSSDIAQFVNATTAKLTNVFLPVLSTPNNNETDTHNIFTIYIDGKFVNNINYTYSYDGALKEISFTFNGLSSDLDETNEILVFGKYKKL